MKPSGPEVPGLWPAGSKKNATAARVIRATEARVTRTTAAAHSHMVSEPRQVVDWHSGRGLGSPSDPVSKFRRSEFVRVFSQVRVERKTRSALPSGRRLRHRRHCAFLLPSRRNPVMAAKQTAVFALLLALLALSSAACCGNHGQSQSQEDRHGSGRPTSGALSSENSLDQGLISAHNSHNPSHSSNNEQNHGTDQPDRSHAGGEGRQSRVHSQVDPHHGHAQAEGESHQGHNHDGQTHYNGGTCSHESTAANGHDAHSHNSGKASNLKSTTDYIVVFAAGAAVPLASFLGNLACRYFKHDVTRFLPILVSFGAGTMLASATVSFIPEAVSHTDLSGDHHSGAFLKIGLPILIGMLVSIVMEFVIHTLGGHHHDHDDLGFADVEKAVTLKGNSEMQAMAWNMLIADAIHNTIDGMLMGTTFMTGIRQGLIITGLIILHELPQEIAELCILLHAGWPMRKAIIRNCLSTLTILIGITVGVALANKFAFVQTYCMAFIAGEFLYVALGQLMPSLARTMMSRRQSVMSHAAFVLGIVFIGFITYQFPHSHGDSQSGHSGCGH